MKTHPALAQLAAALTLPSDNFGLTAVELTLLHNTLTNEVWRLRSTLAVQLFLDTVECSLMFMAPARGAAARGAWIEMLRLIHNLRAGY